MEGWVKFHRKIEEWEWYTDANTFRVFFHLVMKANHKDEKWQGMVIKRGQLVTSPDKIATKLNLTRQKVRTSLCKLNGTEITIKSTNKYTLVTIENYEVYQTCEEEITIKSTNKQPTNNQQITTNKNEKNEKKNNYYDELFDYYIALDLVKHRTLTGDMKKSIDLAMKELKCDVEHLKKMLYRHKQKVENTKGDGEYKTKPRSLAEFFGQKKYKSTSLICSDYDDGIWKAVDKNNNVNTERKIEYVRRQV